MAISLKNIFERVKDSTNLASPILIAREVKQVHGLDKFSETLKDLSIIYSTLSFSELLELCCSGASPSQIAEIKNWVHGWETQKSEKKKIVQRTMRTSTREFKTYTKLFSDKNNSK